MMTKEESLIRSILGNGKSGKRDVRVFVSAVQIARDLIFRKGIAMEEIEVTKDVYPEAGMSLGKSAKAAARQIERLGSLCWDSMDRSERIKYFGEADRFLSPREIIFYLAYYCEHQKSYRDITHAEVEKYFGKLSSGENAT